MKRFVLILLALSLLAFSFAQETPAAPKDNMGMKVLVEGGIAEPWNYDGAIWETGFDVKLGVRAPLSAWMPCEPAIEPLSIEAVLGYFNMPTAGVNGMNAFSLDINAVYDVTELLNIPVVTLAPVAGIRYSTEMLDKSAVMPHKLGLNIGALVGYDLSDLVVEGLGVELRLYQTFDFEIVNAYGNAFDMLNGANLGITYVLPF